MHPGDEAAPGTPGAGEDVCAQCAGTGTLASGAPCALCGRTGKVMRGIGGGWQAFSSVWRAGLHMDMVAAGGR